jgi:hypothetical protein
MPLEDIHPPPLHTPLSSETTQDYLLGNGSGIDHYSSMDQFRIHVHVPAGPLCVGQNHRGDMYGWENHIFYNCSLQHCYGLLAFRPPIADFDEVAIAAETESCFDSTVRVGTHVCASRSTV